MAFYSNVALVTDFPFHVDFLYDQGQNEFIGKVGEE